MEVQVVCNKEKHKVKLKNYSVVRDALHKAGINPETVIAKVNGLIVSQMEELKDKDKIEATEFVSKG